MQTKTLNSSQTNDQNTIMDLFIARLEQSNDKSAYQNSVNTFNQQLFDCYCLPNYISSSIAKQLYQPQNKQPVKLTVPNNNSLIDTMMRTTLGCEETLAKSYMKLLDQTQKIENNQKQKRIQLAKKKFAATNSHTDLYANSKSYMNPTKFADQRPVIDNEQDSYYQTHLIFLENPNGNQGKTKQFFNRQTNAIVKKIGQNGGMEDTLTPMQESLSKNQMINSKNRQNIDHKSIQKLRSISPIQKLGGITISTKQDWINKSKKMRQTMMMKMNFQ